MSVIAYDSTELATVCQAALYHANIEGTTDLFRAMSLANQMAYCLTYNEQPGDILMRDEAAKLQPENTMSADEVLSWLSRLDYNMCSNGGTDCLPENYREGFEELKKALQLQIIQRDAFRHPVEIGRYEVYKFDAHRLVIRLANRPGTGQEFVPATVSASELYDNLTERSEREWEMEKAFRAREWERVMAQQAFESLKRQMVATAAA
jgi:hypothetical protein